MPARPGAYPHAPDFFHELSTVEHERLETKLARWREDGDASETWGGLSNAVAIAAWRAPRLPLCILRLAAVSLVFDHHDIVPPNTNDATKLLILELVTFFPVTLNPYDPVVAKANNVPMLFTVRRWRDDG